MEQVEAAKAYPPPPRPPPPPLIPDKWTQIPADMFLWIELLILKLVPKSEKIYTIGETLYDFM